MTKEESRRNPGSARRWLALVALAVLGLMPFLASLTPPASGFPAYSANAASNTGFCADCHGDFNGPVYTSRKDGTPWGQSLMSGHIAWVNSDCTACHDPFGGATPVRTNSSASMLFPKSCIGCHGRDEDITNDCTGRSDDLGGLEIDCGSGAGLRQRHFDAGIDLCTDCHDDATPQDLRTVGEDVPPFNYGRLAWDPCSDAQKGPTGLDNDGDGFDDAADTDCAVVASTPGQVSLLTVTARDMGLGQLTLSYGVACDASDHTIEFGPLEQVSSYGYSGQECSLGDSGSYVWTYPAGNVFFLLVGNDMTVEGSYGIGVGGAERPEDTVSVTCPLPRDLTNRCDQAAAGIVVGSR